MIRRVVQIRNRLGLHARAAAKLVKTASRYESEVKLSRVGGFQEIDGKSILGILLLAASYGTELEVTVRGSDEIEAAEAIESLVRNRFGEEK
jgi:phosphocarrier protein